MSITLNNVAALENLLEEGLSSEIENNTEVAMFNLADLYKDNGKTIVDTLKSNLNKISPFPIIKPIEVVLTLDNFPTHHYSIMKNKFLAYYIADDISTFVSSDGYVFKTTESTLINLILGVPYPIKLVYDYIPINEHFVSLNLISNIFLNSNSNSIKEVFKSYIYNMECPEDINEIYQALVNIYPIVSKSLKNGAFYTEYIDIEHKVSLAAQSINVSDIVNDDKITSRISLIEDEIQSFCTTNDINIDYLGALDELLPKLYEREPSKYVSYSQEFNTLNDTNYSKFNKICCEYIYLSEQIYNTPLKTYNNFGLFNTLYDISPYITDRTLVKGSYNNIFYMTLATLLQNKEYISMCNICDSDLVTELYKSKIEKKVTSYDIPLLKAYLNAYILGVSSLNDFALYLLEYRSTIAPNDDLKAIYEIIPIVFGDLLVSIDNFNKNPHLGPDNSLVVHVECSPLLKALKSKERIIIKNLIADIQEYCTGFNANNKAKMNIINFEDNAIYLACDEEALSVGIDTLSRRMVSNFDKYMRNFKCSCNIDVL